MTDKTKSIENEKKAFLSGTKADTWFFISIILIIPAISITIATMYVLHIFRYDEKTDVLALVIGTPTLIAASLTLWVSWLIKEEAQNIAHTISNRHEEAIHKQSLQNIKNITIQTSLQKETIEFQTRLPILSAMANSGLTYSAIYSFGNFEYKTYFSNVKFDINTGTIYNLSGVPGILGVLFEKNTSADAQFVTNKTTGEAFSKNQIITLYILRVFLNFVHWSEFSFFQKECVNFLRNYITNHRKGLVYDVDRLNDLIKFFGDIVDADKSENKLIEIMKEPKFLFNFNTLINILSSDSELLIGLSTAISELIRLERNVQKQSMV